MNETLAPRDVYSVLPPTLAPRGLVPAVAAAYAGMSIEDFRQAIEEGKYSQATLPGGNFDQRCLDRDMNRLSGIEHTSPSTVIDQPVTSAIGRECSTIGDHGVSATDAWRTYFAALIEYLAVVHADDDPDEIDEKSAPEAPDPSVLAVYGRNLDWFIGVWKESPHFKTKISEETQGEYARLIRKVASDLGYMPLAVLDDPDIAIDLDEWASIIEETSGPREADARLAVLSSAVTWAIRSRIVPDLHYNYVRGFRRRHSADRSGLIFTDAELDTLCAAADAPIATGILIGSETALRISDVLALTWDQYDGDRIAVAHSKQRTGRPKKILRIPCSAKLRAHLDAVRRSGPTIVATKGGGRWDRRRFSAVFRELCQKTEVVGRHFHDLRGTAITRYAELGMTAEMISAITGHSIKTITQILERYMARTEKMARAVIASVDASRAAGSEKMAG